MDGLEAALKSLGFDIWVDRRRMAGGDDIDAVVTAALSLCDVAVVLVDHDALNSNYMRYEVNSLRYRLAVGDRIAVIPVLLGGVTDQDLATSPAGMHVGLGGLMPVRPSAIKANATTAPATVAEIVAAVDRQALPAPDRSGSPTRMWIELVGCLLKEVPDILLWRAAEKVGMSQVEWDRTRDKRAALAAALLGCPDAQAVYSAMQQMIGFISARDAEMAVDRILPLWVDPDAASVVIGSDDLPHGERLLGLNTRAFRLGRHVVQRATVSSPEYITLPLPDVAGEKPLDEIIIRYDQTLRDTLHLSKLDTAETVLDDLSDRYRGVYVLLRFDTLDPAMASFAIEELQRRFPGVTLILLTAEMSAVLAGNQVRNAYSDFDRRTELRARKYISQTNALISRRVPVDSDE
jgi:hypothetical protein